jgi:hypothetical protein
MFVVGNCPIVKPQSIQAGENEYAPPGCVFIVYPGENTLNFGLDIFPMHSAGIVSKSGWFASLVSVPNEGDVGIGMQ